MSCSGASCGFSRSSLPVSLFGVFDGASAESARRSRFLRRRLDPEFLEVVRVQVPVAAPVSVVVDVEDETAVSPPSSLRRSRRVAGLGAEYDEVLRVSRRCRYS